MLLEEIKAVVFENFEVENKRRSLEKFDFWSGWTMMQKTSFLKIESNNFL